MDLEIVGKNHLEITEALKDFVSSKMQRVNRHVDRIQTARVSLLVDRSKYKAEATVHLSGRDIHVESEHNRDMYAAIEVLIDKLDRQVLKYKEQQTDHHRDGR